MTSWTRACYRPNGELPLESKHDIAKDHQQREQHRQPAPFGQFLTHLRPDELDPAQADINA